MESIMVNLLNPLAKKLLEDLQELDLIEIKSSNKDWVEFLQDMRKHADTAPSMDEIVEEVKKVRAQRYASKK